MPFASSANTNGTVYAVAERAAGLIPGTVPTDCTDVKTKGESE
jgi:choline dehydrogenase-like flavoprotein